MLEQWMRAAHYTSVRATRRVHETADIGHNCAIRLKTDRLPGIAEQRKLALVATVRIFFRPRVAAVQAERNAVGELPVGIDAASDGIGAFAVRLVVEVRRLADTLCHVDR